MIVFGKLGRPCLRFLRTYQRCKTSSMSYKVLAFFESKDGLKQGILYAFNRYKEVDGNYCVRCFYRNLIGRHNNVCLIVEMAALNPHCYSLSLCYLYLYCHFE